MICHRRKFVFVHIAKNGGKSVRKALRPFAFSRGQRLIQYVDTRTFKRDPFNVDPAGAHPSVAQIKSVIGEDIFKDYYSFTFVRNPWSRLLSLYHFTKLRPKSRHYSAAITMDFDGFVEYFCKNDLASSQSSLVLDLNGVPMVDFVGRFESFTEDFKTVCKTLGYECVLPHKNKTRHGDYRSAYSQRSIDTVAKKYANDVKFFSYSFE